MTPGSFSNIPLGTFERSLCGIFVYRGHERRYIFFRAQGMHFWGAAPASFNIWHQLPIWLLAKGWAA